MARSMLIGAPLFVTELGVHEVRNLLSCGDDVALRNLDLGTEGTAGQFLKMMSTVSPLSILKKVNNPLLNRLLEMLTQVTDDLDDAQAVANILGDKEELNPPMNAVADAFNRRRFRERFTLDYQSVELDTLLNSNTKGMNDDDNVISLQKRTNVTKCPRMCFLFQTDNCNYLNCRYRHICFVCQGTSHGAKSCNSRTDTSAQSGGNDQDSQTQTRTQGPPHTRFRRDRAR